MEYKSFKKGNLRFLPKGEESLMEKIFVFLTENTNELILSTRDHKRPPLEGVLIRMIEQFGGKFDKTKGKDEKEFRRVKQCIGRMIAFILEREGYKPIKEVDSRVNTRKALDDKGYFTSSVLYEKK